VATAVEGDGCQTTAALTAQATRHKGFEPSPILSGDAQTATAR
jgi:hypothetical protein